MRIRRKSLFYTPDYEKKFKRLRIVFVLFVVLVGAFIYSHLDYLMFKYFISYNYAYTDALDQLYADTIKEENVKGYMKNFDEVAIAVFTQRLGETAADRYTYLYTPQQYALTKDFEKQIVSEAVVEELDESTVYLYIPSISKYTRKFVTDNKSNLTGYDNLIIDLRSNSGGTLNDMYKIANLFLEKGSTIGYEQTRSAITSSHIKSKGKQELVYENIVFLQDSNTASASEGFIMALKENLDNVTVIGETSFGKGIGQLTLPLKGGFAVKATVMEVKTPDAGSIHRTGITPDIDYDKEDIVEFARQHLTP